jgi:hypothetical protein
MNDFEAHLAHKLERLDAAVPTPTRPVPSALPRPVAGPRKRRRMIMLLVAATVLLASAGAFVATGTQIPPTPTELAKEAADEARVLDDLGAAMSGLCLSLPEAKTLVRQRLDALGLRDWTIRSDDRVREAPCVGAAPAGDADVLLMPSMGGDVGKALDSIGADLMSRCASSSEAVALIRSTLIGLGRADPNVQIGPARGVPVGDGGAFVKHMAAGCAVYGGAQFDDAGRYTWFVSTH